MEDQSPLFTTRNVAVMTAVAMAAFLIGRQATVRETRK